jgi:hypothetical protein
VATARPAGAAERARLVIDPNEISKDGATQLSRFSPDPSGRYVGSGSPAAAPTG